MPTTLPHTEYRHRPYLSWAVLFWAAMTLPRIWYVWRSGLILDEPRAAGQLVWIGFLRDGAIAGGSLLVLSLFRRTFAKLSPGPLRVIFSGLLFVLAFGFGLTMVNAEVLFQAGTPLEIEYFALMTDAAEGPLLFIHNWAAASILILHILILPGIFVWICTRVRFIRLNWFLASKTAFVFILAVLMASATAWNERLSDETRSAIADNYLVHVAFEAAKKRDIRESGKSRIRDLLNTAPLPKPGVKEQEWFYPDPAYPLVKATAHQLCAAGIWKGDVCEADHDGDGVKVQADCNDADPKISPGAVDVPGNGIDEDCSGLDADPPNIIFIHWESARAANVGTLKGFKRHSTPRFDKLAKIGTLFTNAYANGTQTRFSIVPMYCSTLDRLSTKWICRHNPDLELLSTPGILRGRGYHTIYVHGGDNNFSSHSARLWQWFEDVFDKTMPPFKSAKRLNWGLKDKDLFELTYDMLKKREDKRPFYLAIATLSLHFPMALPDPAYEFVPNDRYDNKASNILRYADDALGDFIERVRADPQFANTLIIVAADHGINGNAPTVLDEELVWVPLLLLGDWNIPVGRIPEVRQLADLGPTVLDRLGIEVPNPFVGQSLLRRYGQRESIATFGTANGGAAAGLRTGNWKYWVRFDPHREYLYDLAGGHEEITNLASDPAQAERMNRFYSIMKGAYGENNRLIEENRIWNWKYWPKK